MFWAWAVSGPKRAGDQTLHCGLIFAFCLTAPVAGTPGKYSTHSLSFLQVPFSSPPSALSGGALNVPATEPSTKSGPELLLKDPLLPLLLSSFLFLLPRRQVVGSHGVQMGELSQKMRTLTSLSTAFCCPNKTKSFLSPKKIQAHAKSHGRHMLSPCVAKSLTVHVSESFREPPLYTSGYTFLSTSVFVPLSLCRPRTDPPGFLPLSLSV